MIVLITGATAGFGYAMAQRFIAHGHKVVAAGRREDRLKALHVECGPYLLPVVLDVTDRQAVQQCFQTLPDDFSSIDVLINNAGLALGLEPAQKASLDDWDTMVDTNIKGLMYCTRAVLPGMVARNCGHIVNLGSVAARYPYPGGNVYGASKAFVHQFSLNLRADLLGTAVRVTDIQPGMCSGTEFSTIRFGGDETRAQKVYEGTQSLNADDIADTVYWVVNRPTHVNINAIEMMPVCQAFNAFAVQRNEGMLIKSSS